MKVAIVCDWLVTIGGAEKVLTHLLNIFPDADLFAVVDFLPNEKRAFLKNKKVKTTFIQHLPFAKKHYRNYLPLMPFAIEQLDLSSYELIVSSSHAVAKGVMTGADQLHVSYIHSPMRYAWDLQHQYLQETGLDQKLHGWLARYFLHKLRLWDLRSANGVDQLIANSNYIARRIKKTYRRDALVLYPPVDLAQFTAHHEKENFYLTASRMVPYKKMDLIVESFKFMPDKQLVVIGDGPDFKKIQQKAGPNVRMLGFQTDAVLVDHLQRAQAFIFAAEEDFGLTPVEAQACGTPVIAYAKGGALETIRGLESGQASGLFFYEQSIEAIVNAVAQFEVSREKFTVKNCVDNAKRFCPSIFEAQFKNIVDKALGSFKDG